MVGYSATTAHRFAASSPIGPRLQAVAAGRGRCAVGGDEASPDKRRMRARLAPMRHVRPEEDASFLPGPDAADRARC
jgi:hypothetical protein